MVDKNAYTNVFNDAVQELSSLMERRDELDNEREEIDTRIGQVREGVIALAPLCNVNPYVTYPELFPDLQADIGLTDAIRSVLQLSSQSFLTPVGVRTGLKEAGFDISKKSILPSIHTVLKRLAKNGEVETEDRDGKTVYKWKVQATTRVFGSTPGGSAPVKPGMGHDPKPAYGPGEIPPITPPLRRPLRPRQETPTEAEKKNDAASLRRVIRPRSLQAETPKDTRDGFQKLIDFANGNKGDKKK